jgi:hypothetical protein
MPDRITWSGDWTQNAGTVNGIRLFTIARNVSHVQGYPFTIKHYLPGYKQFARCWATDQAAKDTCERLLRGFYDRLGVAPKPETAPTPEPTEETP